MEITGKTIILAVVSVIIIALILSGVFYLLKNSKQIIPSNKNSNPLGRLDVITASPTEAPSAAGNGIVSPAINNQPVTNTGLKTYQGSNFIIKYPQKWGILTCNNSQNFEFDPYDSKDLNNFACDRAIKPVTILVSKEVLNCQGETVKIGTNQVIKSKTETAYWMKNRWCFFKNGLNFDITNRVAGTGITGTGKDDFSSEIEKIINSL